MQRGGSSGTEIRGVQGKNLTVGRGDSEARSPIFSKKGTKPNIREEDKNSNGSAQTKTERATDGETKDRVSRR